MPLVPRTKIELSLAIFVVVAPFIIVPLSLILHGAPDAIAILLLVLMYTLTGLGGITIGFHRYFTHGSFRVRFMWLAYVFGILGSMAIQGKLSQWKFDHQTHHRYSDAAGDPHSPRRYGRGFLATLRGFAYAHVWWFFVTPMLTKKSGDPIIRRIDQLFIPMAILGLIIPALLGALIRLSFDYVIIDIAWAGVARACFVHHATWSVNSLGHLFGTRPFNTNDGSRNNRLVAIGTFGEGYQNGHHSFPYSARHGLMPNEPDLSYRVITSLEKISLVTNVRVPSRHEVEAKLA